MLSIRWATMTLVAVPFDDALSSNHSMFRLPARADGGPEVLEIAVHEQAPTDERGVLVINQRSATYTDAADVEGVAADITELPRWAMLKLPLSRMFLFIG